MNGKTGYTKNGIIDYGILHTVSCKFDGDFEKFKDNLKNSEFFKEYKNGKGNDYIDTRYRIKEGKCYYPKQEDHSELDNILGQIFLYRNKAFADDISDDGILIKLPSFPLEINGFWEFPNNKIPNPDPKKYKFSATLFFLISESLVNIAILIKPQNLNDFYINNNKKDELNKFIELICRLQKPQDLEVDVEAIFKRFKKLHLEEFVKSLYQKIFLKKEDKYKIKKGEAIYFLSEILFTSYYFLRFKLIEPEKNDNNKKLDNINKLFIEDKNQRISENKYYNTYNKFLDIFDTTLFTTSILFIKDSIFNDTDFTKKILNLVYGYHEISVSRFLERDFINKYNISKNDRSMFFMTYNKFLIVFNKDKMSNCKITEKFNRMVSIAFVVNEIISGVFYSLHYFAYQSTKLVHKRKAASKRFLQEMIKYSNSFFDPNIIQSQLIRELIDKSFEINGFRDLLKTIKDTLLMDETVKVNGKLFWYTVIMTILMILSIVISIILLPRHFHIF